MSTIAQHTNMPEHMLVTRLKSSLDRPNATFGDLMGAVLAAKAELEMFREASHCIGDDDTGAAGQAALMLDLGDDELDPQADGLDSDAFHA